MTTEATTRAEVPALWPYDGSCDYDILATTGWCGSPLREFILKIQSRCNLNCDYCYVYNLADQSWREQPSSMSPELVDALVRRIAEHAEAHGLERVLLSLHGGEPLLHGFNYVADLVDRVHTGLDRVCDVEISMQTNATLVTPKIARGLSDLGVRVGVSLDGDRSANDTHRLDRSARSSFDRTVAGIAELAAIPGLLNGVLCVIDLEHDPVDVFRTVASLGAPSVDFLLPHGTWSEPPPGKLLVRKGDVRGAAPYGAWLSAVYDEWTSTTHPWAVKVRLLSDIVHLCLGGENTFEALGLGDSQLVVVETDGSLELVDHLKSTYDGAASTGLNVFEHSFDEAIRHPGVVCRQRGVDGLPDLCQSCPAVRICGGGLITHRFDRRNGFLNPTVYCSDMYALIQHIHGSLRSRLSPAAR